MKERDTLFRKMNATRDHNDCLKYAKFKAQTRKINEQKIYYWKNFCSTINRHTKSSKIWKTIKKMAGIQCNQQVGKEQWNYL